MGNTNRKDVQWRARNRELRPRSPGGVTLRCPLPPSLAAAPSSGYELSARSLSTKLAPLYSVQLRNWRDESRFRDCVLCTHSRIQILSCSVNRYCITYQGFQGSRILAKEVRGDLAEMPIHR